VVSTGKVAQTGSTVIVHCRLASAEGIILEDTFDEEPLTLTLGQGELIAGLEQVLLGMAAGEEKTVELGPEQAFGMPDLERIMDMDREEFPAEMAIEKGQIIGFTSPSGEDVAGMIREIGESSVTVDFNHPLAGKDIIFDVKLISIE